MRSSIPRGASYLEDKTTDGILREAELDILDKEVCTDYLLENSLEEGKTDFTLTNFICAGGNSNGKACFVSFANFFLSSV